MKPAFFRLGRVALISLACVVAACGGGNDVGSPGSGAGTVQPGPIVLGGDPFCPPRVPGGRDYHGLTLLNCSFDKADLTGANFSGATLNRPWFYEANLTGANFNGATLNGGNFDFANLTDADFSNATIADQSSFVAVTAVNTKFIKTVFASPASFLLADVSCADFSQSDISNVSELGVNNAYMRSGCRTKFQNTKMNCTFVDKWKFFDLTGADISACADQVKPVAGQPGRDFSGGIFSRVAFDNFDLTGSNWEGALLDHASFQGATLDKATGLNGAPGVPSQLSAAKFNMASVQNVDLSNAQLYGARFDNANLSNSSLAGSFLTANTAANPPIETAASFDGAHLRNVTLAGAKLAGATFQYSSFYGTFSGSTPSFPCKAAGNQCTATGFTCGCATASGADLTGTDFSNAYLYGVDFSGATTTINGTKFGSAIVVGASFANASLQVNGGAAPDFTKTMLQGAVFSGGANIGDSSLLNAFVDFGAATNPSTGNVLFLRLTADYTQFKGWNGTSATPCVSAPYGVFTALPANVQLTCPNGSSTVCGAGTPAPNGNPNWAGGIRIVTNAPVAGGYLADATFDKAQTAAPGTCNNQPVDPNW